MGNVLSIAAVLGFVLIGGAYFASTQLQMHETNRGVAADEYAVLARSVAIAGTERAMQHLASSFTNESFEGYFDQGTYDVVVTVSGTTATIISEGSVTASGNHQVTRTVRIVIQPVTSAVPPGFEYGLLVGGDLGIGGSGNILSIGVTDSTGATLNASVHTNSDLDVDGESANVAGFGSYSGSIDAPHGDVVFDPNYNPDGDPVIAYSEPVLIPILDPLQLANEFGIDVNVETDMPGSWSASGKWNCDLSGTLPGGSAADPLVIYCPGSMRLEDLLVEGYAIFIGEAETMIKGLVHSDVSTYPDGETSSLAIYSVGDILMSGSDEVWAQLFTNGTLKFHGEVVIYGSLITSGSLDLRGGATIHYRPTAEVLVMRRELLAGFRMVAYSEE
ncbi:MAG: hypothetical protein IH855_08545 [Bacteroidetes bacterium]|nr:hypothetical protein [Bacteroidota bacterium]